MSTLSLQGADLACYKDSLQFRGCRAGFNLPQTGRLPCWGKGCITINININTLRPQDSLAPTHLPIRLAEAQRIRRIEVELGVRVH